MRYFFYYEPIEDGTTGKTIIITSEEIISGQYWSSWTAKLKSLNREHLISKQNCIDDFCTINWAQEITKEKYLDMKSSDSNITYS